MTVRAVARWLAALSLTAPLAGCYEHTTRDRTIDQIQGRDVSGPPVGFTAMVVRVTRFHRDFELAIEEVSYCPTASRVLTLRETEISTRVRPASSYAVGAVLLGSGLLGLAASDGTGNRLIGLGIAATSSFFFVLPEISEDRSRRTLPEEHRLLPGTLVACARRRLPGVAVEVRGAERTLSGRSDDLGIARLPTFPRNNAEVFVEGALVSDVTVDW